MASEKSRVRQRRYVPSNRPRVLGVRRQHAPKYRKKLVPSWQKRTLVEGVAHQERGDAHAAEPSRHKQAERFFFKYFGACRRRILWTRVDSNVLKDVSHRDFSDATSRSRSDRRHSPSACPEKLLNINPRSSCSTRGRAVAPRAAHRTTGTLLDHAPRTALRSAGPWSRCRCTRKPCRRLHAGITP